MNKILKILLVAIILTAVFTRERIFKQFGINQAVEEPNSIALNDESVKEAVDPSEMQAEAEMDAYLTNDSLFRWDEEYFEWLPVVETFEEFEQKVDMLYLEAHSAEGPIELKWEVLTNVRYQLRYFDELEMEILAPVFPNAIKALDGKEIIIEGFAIPFDGEQGLLSLSANSYASCFFCGRASPASVMSMYLKNERKRYKMDDFLTFRGTLHLNYDDPNQFYYILRDAEAE